MNENFDAARLTLLLSELRLPATKQIWASFAGSSFAVGQLRHGRDLVDAQVKAAHGEFVPAARVANAIA